MRKPTELQRAMLTAAEAGDNPFMGCNGRGQPGGWQAAWQSLFARGWLKATGPGGRDYEITETGRAALAGSE